MEKRLTQQGNQADKLLPEVYKLLKQEGLAPTKVYSIGLSEDNTVLLNAGVDITVAAKQITTDYDVVVVTLHGGAMYTLTKTAVFGSSAVFSAVMSLDTTLMQLVGYVTSDALHLQTCRLPMSTNIAVHLDIGDLQEVKDNNLLALKSVQGHFFVNIDYGYGVGTYQTGVGGFAHVTTAYGYEIFYRINADGSVVNEEDYLKPNEPYTVVVEAQEIGIPIGDILAARIVQAGELIVRGSTGLITYTRTVDSTDTNIYFANPKKDGSLAVLAYSVSGKTLTLQ